MAKKGRYSRTGRKKREIRNKILIICGGKTEKIYFEQHRANLARVTVKADKHDESPSRIVNRAIKEKKNKEYIQIWCVFDKDDFNDFDEAIDLAEKNEIRYAFSNEAFELWFLLHFKYIECYKNRKKCIEELEKELGIDYDKVDEKIYGLLEGKMSQAVLNAKKAHQRHMADSGKQSNWSSCTTVYLLIEELNRWKK